MSPDLRALIDEFQRQIAELLAENDALKQEVAELRCRLGKDSSNSNKPPSSDGLGKKPRVAGSLSGQSGKRSGRQRGHKGDTLRASAAPDTIHWHEAGACAHCWAGLTAAMAVGVEKRQVFDLPAPRLDVAEHQALIYACACCRRVTKAAFPAGVVSPVQYGPRIRAAAVYLSAQQLIPEDRVGDIMHELFGAGQLCPASICAWSAKKACELAPFEAEIAAMAPVRHLDETGFRIGGKTRWLHTVSTPGLRHYRVSEKRGALPTTLKGGVIVHDHFKPYYRLPGVDHALCNAHHLRELKALTEIEKEPWAKNMSRLLLRANAIVRRARERGADTLAEACLRRITALYDAIVAQGLAFHEQQPPLAVRRPGSRGRLARRTGHNLVTRLRDFKGDTLRFLSDFAVPFTNNTAEQDIRMMNVKMKISGSFRTPAGAKVFATLRSVLATARKHGLNPLAALTAPAPELIARLTA